jgi:acyl carrier protein
MVAEKVISIIAATKRISPERVTIDSSFEELGVDSLDGVEIVCELEETFDITIPDAAVHKMRSVREVVENLEALLGGKEVKARSEIWGDGGL